VKTTLADDDGPERRIDWTGLVQPPTRSGPDRYTGWTKVAQVALNAVRRVAYVVLWLSMSWTACTTLVLAALVLVLALRTG
jgi:hypothetical protein